MRISLRALWLKLQASYWLIPSVLTIFALILAFTTVWLDHLWDGAWLTNAGIEAPLPRGARAQLSVIASSMITVASTVFAITIAAVAYASGNYGPRLLTNFMNDRGNQLSLGVFISTFVYNLAVLRAVRSSEPTPEAETATEAAAAFVPQLSLLVSSLTALIAVGFLVFFLHHIPASIKIDSVLAGIGRKLLADIKKRFPIEAQLDDRRRQVVGETVTARQAGYIQIIDFEELDEIARECEIRIALKVRTGDFIHPHLPVAEIEGHRLDEEIQKRLLGCFSLGASRTPTQDLEFLIDELVEIAVRALSPGINDAFTAVTSLHWLGAALSELGDRDLRVGPEQGNYDNDRVQPLSDDFDHFLAQGFGAARTSVASNDIAVKVCLEVLNGVRISVNSEERRAAVMAEARTTVESAEAQLSGPALTELRERWAEIEREANRDRLVRAKATT